MQDRKRRSVEMISLRSTTQTPVTLDATEDSRTRLNRIPFKPKRIPAVDLSCDKLWP